MFNQMGRDNLLRELREAKAEIERLQRDNQIIAEQRTRYGMETIRLRAVLELMDDRKHMMMPRSQMARLAKAALDFGMDDGGAR